MEFNAYIGLDVHKETIAVAIAETGRTGEVRFYGEIANTPDAVANLLKSICSRPHSGAQLEFARIWRR
jgi:hypothetical protein